MLHLSIAVVLAVLCSSGASAQERGWLAIGVESARHAFSFSGSADAVNACGTSDCEVVETFTACLAVAYSNETASGRPVWTWIEAATEGGESGRAGEMRGFVRPAVLHLRDLRVWILRMSPVLVGALLSPLPVEACQLLSGQRRNPGRCSQAAQERIVSFARVSTDDAPQDRVRFKRRRVDADGLALQQPPSATRRSTQVKTASCVSTSIRRRVRDTVEWSGEASCTAMSRNCHRLTNRPRATPSPVPTPGLRNSRATASGNSCPVAATAGRRRRRRTSRIAPRRRHRSPTRRAGGSSARRARGLPPAASPRRPLTSTPAAHVGGVYPSP